jgi:hypothetical protein
MQKFKNRICGTDLDPGRRRGPKAGTKREDGIPRQIEALTGRSFQIEVGIPPIYPGTTIVPAFWAGVEAARSRQSMEGSRVYRAAAARESWLDGFIWASANLPTPTIKGL